MSNKKNKKKKKGFGPTALASFFLLEKAFRPLTTVLQLPDNFCLSIGLFWGWNRQI